MGSSGPGQNSVDSLDTVNKNTSLAFRAYFETYFLKGGDTVEPWVSRRPHGQHGGKWSGARSEDSEARTWTGRELLLQPADHGLCPPWRHCGHSQADAEEMKASPLLSSVCQCQRQRVYSYLANSQSVSSDRFPWSTIFSHFADVLVKSRPLLFKEATCC